MNRNRRVAAICAAALLAACEARIGKDEADDAAAGGNAVTAAVSAEGKSEEGSFSIDAPGFDLKFDIPKGLADHADVESDDGLLYPGVALSGMHIQAAERGRDGGAVEIRFTSADAPMKIAVWYRDPARAGEITIASAREEGGGFVIEGTQKDDGDPFKVTLGPRAGGGSDGRLILSDRG